MFLRLAFFLLILSAGITGVQGEKAVSPQEIKILEAELSLAKQNAGYILLRSRDKKIILKIRGMTVREWKIDKLRYWGVPFSTDPVALIKKKSLFLPRREKIKVKKPDKDKKEENFSLEALELEYMPAAYKLILDKNTVIYVKPKAGGLTSWLRNASHSLRWYIVSPLRSVFSALKRRPYKALDLTLVNKMESWSLFWVLSDGMRFLIYY